MSTSGGVGGRRGQPRLLPDSIPARRTRQPIPLRAQVPSQSEHFRLMARAFTLENSLFLEKRQKDRKLGDLENALVIGGRRFGTAVATTASVTTVFALPREQTMDAIKTSAKFAAFVWHSEVFSDSTAGDAVNQRRARRFAAEHWPSFLPWSHEGLGKLLRKVAGPCRPRKRRDQRRSRVALVSA